MSEKLYLNAGCGNTRMHNAINMDIADNKCTAIDIEGSILDPPFPDEHFDGVVLSHVFEHLTQQEHDKCLGEIRRILKNGGKVYIETPDFDQVLKNYLENYRGNKEYWYMAIFGRRLYEGDAHKSGITHQYLADHLFRWCFGDLKWIESPRYLACLGVTATKKEWQGKVRL